VHLPAIKLVWRSAISLNIIVMNTHLAQSKLRLLAYMLTAIAVPLTMQACRSKDDGAGGSNTQSEKTMGFTKASLTKDQSSFINSQESSAVNWHGWHKDLLKQAASEKKTIFAIIGSGTNPNTLEVLARINESPAICSLLNGHHINVLIDSNLHPDMEFLAASLCMTSQTNASTPILVWFSYQGHPISWNPVERKVSSDIAELISRMSQTIHSMWLEGPEYVLAHSRDDYEKRMVLSNPETLEEAPYTPGVILKAARKSASLFDPTSNTIDNIGNLSPARYVELMVRASHHPDLSPSQREHYLELACLTADHLIIHGLADPLDGGVFSGVQYTTNALPRFSKTLRAQALSMKALYSVYQSTQDPHYLKAADSILAYTKKTLSLDGGGYALGTTYLSDKENDNPCIWTLDEIEAALSEKEFEVASIAFGLNKLGNIPFIDNPNQAYSKKNSLTWKVTIADLASQTSMNSAALTKTLESITGKLAKLRSENPLKPFTENLTTSGSAALFASACLSGYRATGNPSYLEQAKDSLTHTRNSFIDQDGNLHRARFNGSLHSHPAMGADHALVCQAALDLHEVTLDPTWLEFAHDLHSRMNKMLADTNNHHIKEYDGTGYPQPYIVNMYYTIHELDNDSTWGLAHSNAKRLSLRLADETFSPQIEKLEPILRKSALASPTACIDFLTRECIANTKRVYIKTPASPELLATASKYPCQIIAVTDEGAYPELGPETAKLTAGTATVVATVAGQGKTIGSASSAAELDALLK